MIRAWRLVKSRYVSTAFDGEGARLYGGRWNSPGTRVAYASENVELAVLEVLVHLQSSAALDAYWVASLEFPEAGVEVLNPSTLPPQWRRYPPPAEVQAIGDEWVSRMRSVVLRVPSVVISSADNFLVNPAHPDFSKVTIDPPEPFEFDPRLLRRRTPGGPSA